MTFDEADKVVHKVEDQWHYKVLFPLGFIPRNREGVGFVRSYTYDHPNGHVIKCSTGVSADYWSCDGDPSGSGLWSTLEPYAKRLLGVV